MNVSDPVCLVPRLTGSGGPAVFQEKLARGLRARGVEVVYDLDRRPTRAVLVIGGTRSLGALRGARRAGIPIIQRLDGMNWIHRRRRTGLRHYLRAEYGNLSLRLIRRRLADRIVYQSHFARLWWEKEAGPSSVPAEVIYNGVDLQAYTPHGREKPPADRWRILVVEGSLAGGYDVGIEHAAGLARKIGGLADRPIELVVAGVVPEAVRSRTEARGDLSIVWAGRLPREEIPALDRSAHMLFSADLNPACPNAVIEAMACGLPVLSYDTGSLPELVTPEAGRIVPYGGDPWSLDPPDAEGLALAGREILENRAHFQAGARTRAEEEFGLDQMVEGYLETFR